jgi:hypothetical protein
VPSSEFLVTNSWQGPLNAGDSTWYVLWAGSTGSNTATPGTPGVILHIQSPSPDGFGFTDSTVGTFLDAQADGALAIVGVTGTSVGLVTPSGSAYHFDLETHSFS